MQFNLERAVGCKLDDGFRALTVSVLCLWSSIEHIPLPSVHHGAMGKLGRSSTPNIGLQKFFLFSFNVVVLINPRALKSIFEQ